MSSSKRRKMIIGIACAAAVCVGAVVGLAWAVVSNSQSGTEGQIQVDVTESPSDGTSSDGEEGSDTASSAQSQEAGTSAQDEIASTSDKKEAGSSSNSDAGSRGTGEYSNARYGYRMQVPVSFSITSEADNGSGAVFKDAESGMVVTFWGGNNASGSDAQTMYDQLAAGHEVAYGCVEEDFCVVSYMDGDTVVYTKQFVGSRSYCGVSFEYGQAHKAECDALLEQMIGTFEPGDMTIAH